MTLASLRGRRGIAMLALAASALAFGVVVRPALATLADREARLDEVEQALVADRAAIAGLRTYPERRERYRTQLGLVDLRSSDAVLVADFLDAAVRVAASRRVTIVSLTADPRRTTAPPATFREIPFVLTEEGRYGDVLATIDGISRLREIVRVEAVDFTRLGTTTRVGRRGVRAVISARVLRLDRDPLTRPPSPAPGGSPGAKTDFGHA